MVSPRILSYGSSPDVLSEPDDSYPPIRESKKIRKVKGGDPSRGIGAFFGNPPTSAVGLEDVVMNEGGTVSAGEEPNEVDI